MNYPDNSTIHLVEVDYRIYNWYNNDKRYLEDILWEMHIWNQLYDHDPFFVFHCEEDGITE